MTQAEIAVFAYLAKMKIPYRIARHRRISAISECTLAEKLLGGVMPRNLFLAPKNNSAHYLLLAHPESIFRTSSVSRQAGSSRLSFGSEEALSRLLHTHPGAVSPMGFVFEEAKEVRLLVDRRLFAEKTLIFHPLENTSSVRMAAGDFFGLFLPSLGKNLTTVDLDEQKG